MLLLYTFPMHLELRYPGTIASITYHTQRSLTLPSIQESNMPIMTSLAAVYVFDPGITQDGVNSSIKLPLLLLHKACSVAAPDHSR